MMNRITERPRACLDLKSPAVEAYRTLRTNIEFCRPGNLIHTLAVTSSIASEGKSTTAINLALSFAQADHEVLLIDADLRRPVIHHNFDLPNTKGLSNLLVGQTSILEEIIHATSTPKLSILPSGPVPPNPAELLRAPGFKEILASLRDYADFIIIDTSPVAVVTDAALIGSQVDGVILVVRPGRVPRAAALQAKRNLENVNANILGMVVNEIEIKSRNYYYRYYRARN